MRIFFTVVGIFVHTFALAAEFEDSMFVEGSIHLISSAGNSVSIGTMRLESGDQVSSTVTVQLKIERPSLLHPKRLFLTNDQVLTIDDGFKEYLFWIPEAKYRTNLDFFLSAEDSGQNVDLKSTCKNGIWRVELFGIQGHAVIEKSAGKMKFVQCS